MKSLGGFFWAIFFRRYHVNFEDRNQERKRGRSDAIFWEG